MSLSSGSADPKWFARTPGPQMWFHPNITLSSGDRYLGPTETAAAYSDDAEWGRAIAACDVMGTYVDPARETPTGTDGFLTNFVRMANSYNKAIAIEVGGPYGTVGLPTGETSAAHDISTSIANIVALGGTVRYLSMDHPIQRVITGLGLTQADGIAQTVDYIQTIHDTYPDIGVGMIDQSGHWSNPSTAFFGQLMDALAAVGEKLAFYHVDMPAEYSGGGVMYQMAAVQRIAASYGVRFGHAINTQWGGGADDGSPSLIFGGAPQSSDAYYQQLTLVYAERLRELIDTGFLLPYDNVLIQSWYHFPRDLAPDTTPYTFCDTFLKAKTVFNTP